VALVPRKTEKLLIARFLKLSSTTEQLAEERKRMFKGTGSGKRNKFDKNY
jgi:hypothetical protein